MTVFPGALAVRVAMFEATTMFRVLFAPWISAPLPVKLVETVMVPLLVNIPVPFTVVVGEVSVVLLISAPPAFTVVVVVVNDVALLVILPETARLVIVRAAEPPMA